MSAVRSFSEESVFCAQEVTLSRGYAVAISSLCMQRYACASCGCRAVRSRMVRRLAVIRAADRTAGGRCAREIRLVERFDTEPLSDSSAK